MGIIESIKNLFKKPEKVPRPDPSAVIKIHECGKGANMYSEPLKEIEKLQNGKITYIKYSEAEVQSLLEQGIPVQEEEYSEEHTFTEISSGGALDNKL